MSFDLDFSGPATMMPDPNSYSSALGSLSTQILDCVVVPQALPVERAADAQAALGHKCP